MSTQYYNSSKQKYARVVLCLVMLRETLVPTDRRPLSFYWNLMWSLSYVACFVVKPDVSVGNTGVLSLLVYPSFGVMMLAGLVLHVRPVLFGCGVLEVFAGVASWTGTVHWNVAWTSGYDPLAQITMAVLDLISAVFLFEYALNSQTTHQH